MSRKVIVMAALIGSAAQALPTPPAHFYATFGGEKSCATALSNETQESLAAEYTWGAWSGLNMGEQKNVGLHTDGNGIWGEVKLYCTNNPSQPLVTGIIRTYRKLEAEGR